MTNSSLEIRPRFHGDNMSTRNQRWNQIPEDPSVGAPESDSKLFSGPTSFFHVLWCIFDFGWRLTKTGTAMVHLCWFDQKLCQQEIWLLIFMVTTFRSFWVRRNTVLISWWLTLCVHTALFKHFQSLNMCSFEKQHLILRELKVIQLYVWKN